MLTSSRVLGVLAVVVMLPFAAESPAQPAGVAEDGIRSHCAPTDKVFFHCVVEGSRTLASLCGTSATGPEGAETKLTYRFGAAGDVEFTYPTNRPSSIGRFHFERQSTRDGSTVDYFLWFRNGAWIYEVYYREEFEHCEEDRCSDQRTGQAALVSAWRGAEAWRTGDESRGRRFLCSNPEDNAGLKELEGLQSRDPDAKRMIFGNVAD